MGRKKISAFDAKTHLGQLLRDAESGQSYLIVRRGKPVARLEPVEAPEDRDYKRLAAAFREIRKRIRGRVNVRDLINEGRRI
ncbi:MAG TPA: type II toxin-antitoxin system prevent-host-death family antitoxin [Elusimicrobiota bacterium]|nr:type II toxin-antitoxin system prevent-host-death family antitoxin [Elusimicrobiota bacterium]